MSSTPTPHVVNSKLTGILYRYPLGLRHHHQLFRSLCLSLSGFLAIVVWSPLSLVIVLLLLSMMTLGNTLNIVGPLEGSRLQKLRVSMF